MSKRRNRPKPPADLPAHRWHEDQAEMDAEAAKYLVPGWICTAASELPPEALPTITMIGAVGIEFDPILADPTDPSTMLPVIRGNLSESDGTDEPADG